MYMIDVFCSQIQKNLNVPSSDGGQNIKWDGLHLTRRTGEFFI